MIADLASKHIVKVKVFNLTAAFDGIPCQVNVAASLARYLEHVDPVGVPRGGRHGVLPRLEDLGIQRSHNILVYSICIFLEAWRKA